MDRNKANILGVGVSSTSFEEVLEIFNLQFSISKRKQPFLVATVNPEFLLEAQKDAEFKKILNNFDLALPDGVGLKFARPGLEIIPGRKLVEEILQLEKYKIFYLGGQDGVAEEMAKKFGGTFDPGEDDIKHPTRNAEIIAQINKFKPDILLVAYGAPWQEKWIWNNKNVLKTRVCIGVGGSFDYLTGRSAMPPKIIEQMGLEWLWRLILQPWRWKRQLSLIKFLLLQIFSPRRL